MRIFNIGLRCRRRTGWTLVEVVAGLALLASLIVGMLLAYGAHQRQVRGAEQRLQAIEMADRLLATWHGSGRPIPRGRSGTISQPAGAFAWRTATVRRQLVGRTGFDVVRVEIFSGTGPRAVANPLASVEVVAPPSAVDLLLPGSR